MPKIVLVLLLALSIVPATAMPAPAQDVVDFGDPLPLPPPPIDDAPAPLPAGLLGDQSAPAPVNAPSLPAAPAIPPLPAPAASSDSAVPAAPPLTVTATETSTTTDNVTTIDLPAQPDSSVSASVTVAVEEKPLPAKISGGRVNVRAGPNTQYESIAVLTTGSPITVLAKNAEWYKIIYPADQLASIHKNFVIADITGEIPEEGVIGVVNQDNADVHAFYWDKSTVVGQLNKGDQVRIMQERGQWYRIAAPESARAYVFAEYVRVDGNEAVPADMAQAPENPAIDLTAGKPDTTGRLKLSENDRQAAALKEAYFSRLKENQKRMEEQEAQQANQLEMALDELDMRLKSVDAETAQQLSYPMQTTTLGYSQWAPPDPLYGGFTGWVENIGRVGGAPSSFRLSKGGEVRFYLRSNRFNLGDFVGRRVWVNGNIDLAAGAAANILNVDQICVLTEMEIAEGMTEQPVAATTTTTTTTTTTYDPYAAQGATTYDPYAATTTTTYDAVTTTTAAGTPIIAPYDPYETVPSVTVNPGQPYPAETVDTYSTTTFTPSATYTPTLTTSVPPLVTSAPPAGTTYTPPISETYTTTTTIQPYIPASPSSPAASDPWTAAAAAQAQTPTYPVSPEALPDHFGPGAPAAAATPAQPVGGSSYGSAGEVGSDYYEQPFVSEVGP